MTKDQCAPYREMPDGAYFECRQLCNAIREYTEQIKRFNNQLHSIKLLPVPSKHLAEQIEYLEIKLEAILQQWQPEQLKNVSSKAFGKRATAMLIVFTQGFKNTHNHIGGSLQILITAFIIKSVV